MNLEEYRSEVLRYICEFAEFNFDYIGAGISKKNFGRETSFKPGTSDKMLFLKIINKNINSINDENIKGNPKVDALVLLKEVYYPYYEWFDREQIELSRED